MSRLCLGCMSYGGGDLPDWALGTKGWHVDKAGAREHFRVALDAGINFFDTADVYSIGASEEITGALLKEMAVRDHIVVATKVHGVMGPSPNQRGLSRKHIIEACEKSLRRLQMDYVDLYQIHRWDPKTPIEEIDSRVERGAKMLAGAGLIDVPTLGAQRPIRQIAAAIAHASQAEPGHGDSSISEGSKFHVNVILASTRGQLDAVADLCESWNGHGRVSSDGDVAKESFDRGDFRRQRRAEWREIHSRIRNAGDQVRILEGQQHERN